MTLEEFFVLNSPSSLVTVLHTSSWTILKWISMQLYHVVQEFWACSLTTISGTNALKNLALTKGCYACQWLDNVDMHMYAKFDQNILCGWRVIPIVGLVSVYTPVSVFVDCLTERSLMGRKESNQTNKQAKNTNCTKNNNTNCTLSRISGARVDNMCIINAYWPQCPILILYIRH